MYRVGGISQQVKVGSALRRLGANLCSKCKQDIKNIPVRFVPIPTSHFIGELTRCDSFAQMAGAVENAIQKEGANSKTKCNKGCKRIVE